MKVIVFPTEKVKPLIEEEQQDKKKKIEIYKDKDLQKRAMATLKKILEEASQTDKEKVRCVLTREDKEDYIKWKSAFLSVVKYRFREIALAIEAALEQQNKYQAEDVFQLSEQNPEQINLDTIVQTEGKESNSQEQLNK